MSIQNVPEIFTKTKKENLDFFVYDYKMSGDVFKSKVNLSLHMFSFLQKGSKEVHLANASVAVHDKQSILIKKGNCLWSELLENDDIYYCKLLFFSDNKLKEFLKKHSPINSKQEGEKLAYFIIENDEYITSYLRTLSTMNNTSAILNTNLLSLKLEELMLYLIEKYGISFENYLHSLITKEDSSFKNIIENNIYSTLKTEEIAFLCHMSLSTFKRNFVKTYKTTPGKWLQDKRLHKAKELLENGAAKPSDIYLDFGYNNLSNFSTAFKNKFGKSPNLINS